MHRVGVAEQVVQVAEDLLVGADEEDAEVVVLAGERVQLEHVLDVAAIDEVSILPSESQVMSASTARRVGSSLRRWIGRIGKS